MTATLRAEVGPVDDEGILLLDGQEVVALGLNESTTIDRDLDNGDHEIRFTVKNSGSFGWKARLRLLVNDQEVAKVNRSGVFGVDPVFDRTWQIGIVRGELDTF
jgi:hypothetical protein